MKRGNVIFGTLVFVVLMTVSMISGCSTTTKVNPADKQVATTKDVFIIGDKGTPLTLAPYAETSSDRCRVTNQLYETLIYAEMDGTFTPLLATSWEWKDTTHLVFKLRQGVKFHNGNAFTAADVLFTLQYAVKSPISNIYSVVDIDNCKVIDDYTFELALKRPDSLILSYIGIPNQTSILDKETCEADPKSMQSNPVGTGPYKLKNWVVGDTVTLERYSDYWGKKPIIKDLVFRKISESTQRVIELETGGVDFIYDAPISSVASLKKETDKYTIFQNPSFLITNLYFNATPGKTMDNLELRKAIAYAIDYDAIVKGAANGAGAPPASFASRIAVGAENLNPKGTQLWPYDVAKAKESMAKAGYPNGGLTLNLVVNPDNPLQSGSVEQIANSLKAIGITLNIKQSSLGALIGYVLNVNNPWDIVVFGNAEPTSVLQAARMDKTQCPFLAYKRDDQQKILDQMWTTTDSAKMADLLKQLSVNFNENVPYVPYHEDLNIMAAASNLQGIKFSGAYLRFEHLYFN